jgi:hypothetical protein
LRPVFSIVARTGARTDLELARLDRATDLDWPRVMAWNVLHPSFNLAAKAAQNVRRFQLALSALACIAIWSLAPSFGAFSLYLAPRQMRCALPGLAASPSAAVARRAPLCRHIGHGGTVITSWIRRWRFLSRRLHFSGQEVAMKFKYRLVW